MNKCIMHKCRRTFDANPKKAASSLWSLEYEYTTNNKSIYLKMVEHIAEQSAAIKLLQQGIVYQKVK